jgi:hypothetical protein
MTLEVDTKDCTALADTELAEMADIVTDGPAGIDIGLLSKQAEAWVRLLHPRAHRRDPVPAVGSGLGGPHGRA